MRGKTEQGQLHGRTHSGRRVVTAVVVATMLVTAIEVGAQEGAFGEGESFGSGFGDSFGETPSEPSISWGGTLRIDTRATADYYDPEESAIATDPEVLLDLSYEAKSTDVFVSFDVRPEYLEGSDGATEFAEELVDEAYLSLYYDSFDIRVGYFKEVWGTGDEFHVVDVLNSTDYRDFIIPDYVERRLASPMLLVAVPIRVQGSIEAADLPIFAGDEIPREGPWAPAAATELTAVVEGAVAAAGGGLENSLIAESSILEPDTSTVEWGQYAARYRDTFGGMDLGIIYYHGFLKEPSIALSSPGGNPELFALGDKILLDYDRVNVFGLEYAAVVATINTRAEVAYYLTGDGEGDDPSVTNPSLRYLAGFDRDLPLSNLNVNVQAIGTVTLHSDAIKENVEEEMTYDFQYDEDGEYTRHIVSAALRDSLANDTIRPEAAVSYGVEDQDVYVNPSVEITLLDDVLLRTEAAIFAGADEGYFGQFDAHDFLEVRLEYSF